MARPLQPKYGTPLRELINTILARNGVVADKLEELTTRQIELLSSMGLLDVITKADVGLEFTPNWPPATVTDVVQGESSSAIVSPRLLDEYADANLYTPLTDLFTTATNNLS